MEAQITGRKTLNDLLAEMERRAPWRREPSLAVGYDAMAKRLWFDAVVLARACFDVIADGPQDDEWIAFLVERDTLEAGYFEQCSIESPVGRLLYMTTVSDNPKLRKLGTAFFLSHANDEQDRLADLMAWDHGGDE
jgi:hypothetical protein